jgi:hypothetical protein
MTGEHHGQSAGRATVLVRTVDEILGTHTAWTAAATSCAVSASMTMFRRSSTRRATCRFGAGMAGRGWHHGRRRIDPGHPVTAMR